LSALTHSYRKVHYELRPAKQVERRMFIDVLQKLMELSFPISDYQYTGMGSVHFIDFILFHRYLGISDMVSVERSRKIDKRLEFNRPFSLVKIVPGDIANQISSLSPDRKHLLWLDYDQILDRGVLKAVHLAMAHLPPRSILILTVDAMPPGGDNDGPRNWQDHFETEAGNYLWPNSRVEDFQKDKLVSVNIRILKSVISGGLVGRTDVDFCPLFNILYQDGHEMLTVGGMIADRTDRALLRALDKPSLPFLRQSLTSTPYKIRIPLITRKERLYLNSAMPCDDCWKPEAFEMTKRDVADYSKIYKYYPAFAEMLL
jgi:hypothetical protein